MSDSISYYRSPLGIISIKSEEESITEILFINSYKGAKVDEAEINFKTSKSSIIKKCVKQLDEYFLGEKQTFELAISQSGTFFQKEVWGELINIPYGKTISYLTLAKKIENTKATRAVGTANGNNKICIVVPCHRVIGSKGDLVGYGGDLWRKKWLLDHEAKFAHGVQKLF